MVLTKNIESVFTTDSFHSSKSTREEVCNQVIHEGMSSLDAGKINLPYRMEYRKGYPLAKHLGEERFLLFRSDRPGAIAKIVFSSEDCTEDDETDQGKDTQNPINLIAIAKIHVLEVKKEHRGNDFGGLLFHQATTSLLHRYDFVDCHLDAEEDSRRHDRLILFYKQLGFQVKPRAKIKYINNNDGEIYRKVPMCINLKRLTSKKSLVGVRFLPIRLLHATGESTKIAAMDVPSLGRNIKWLMMDDGSGKIIFQTTVGCYLRIEDTGFCAVSDLHDDFCQFHVFTVSQFNSENGSDPTQVQGKNLLLFQSSRGFFLSVHENYLSGSRCPSFWDLDEDSCTLTCSNDFPSLPLDQALLKRPQLIGELVEPQFSNISLKLLTIKEGLYWLKEIPFRPLHTSDKTISLRTFCYQVGEAARTSGHPDWFQLVAIM
jgi:ribosomal protein S18 acetylase RimI-like enzyme